MRAGGIDSAFRITEAFAEPYAGQPGGSVNGEYLLSSSESELNEHQVENDDRIQEVGFTLS